MSNLKIEQRVIKVIHTGKQGLAGPPGPASEGLDPAIVAGLVANPPTADNPVATMEDIPESQTAETTPLDSITGLSPAAPNVQAGMEALQVNKLDDSLTSIAALLNSSGGVTSPADVDKWGFRDSVSGLWAHMTSASIKAWLRGYFDTIYASFTSMAGKLDRSANVYTTKTASFTVTADMLGWDIPVDITDGIITLPAWSGTGFGNGWQCKIVNLDATALTYSGTVDALGTKQPAKSTRVIQIINGGWFIGGLTS